MIKFLLLLSIVVVVLGAPERKESRGFGSAVITTTTTTTPAPKTILPIHPLTESESDEVQEVVARSPEFTLASIGYQLDRLSPITDRIDERVSLIEEHLAMVTSYAYVVAAAHLVFGVLYMTHLGSFLWFVCRKACGKCSRRRAPMQRRESEATAHENIVMNGVQP